MPEVEVKILEVDVPAMEAKLLSLGAVKTFEGDIRASLFDFPDGRLNARHSFVRLRSKGEKTELVFKQRLANEVAKSYEEIEVEVSDMAVAQEFLERIGLVETVHGRRKHRISYRLGHAQVELDEFDGMPAFMELEVSDSDELPELVESLGYTMADTKPWGGREVYEHYGVEYPRV